jgi:hypothetical protein
MKLDKAKEDKRVPRSDVYTLGLRRLGTASDEDVKKGEETLRARTRGASRTR